MEYQCRLSQYDARDDKREEDKNGKSGSKKVAKSRFGCITCKSVYHLSSVIAKLGIDI